MNLLHSTISFIKQKTERNTIVKVLFPALPATLAIFIIFSFIPVLYQRFYYPLDLEWMESGMLIHIQRILEGKPLFVKPGVNFIPFAYTPLYYYVTSFFSLFFGLDYQIARAVSLFSLLGSFFFAFLIFRNYYFSKQFQKNLFCFASAVIFLGLLLSNFIFSGSWLDLARVDTLFLFLLLSSFYFTAEKKSISSAVISGFLISMAFWTKQTAFPYIIITGGWLLVVSRRRFAAYTAVVTTLCGLGVLLWNSYSDNWLWFYIRKIHQNHSFNVHIFFKTSPLQLLKREYLLWFSGISSGAFIIFFKKGAPFSKFIFWWLILLTSIFVSCLGMATQWAHTNALLPGIFFPPLVILITLLSSLEYLNLPTVFRTRLTETPASGLACKLKSQISICLVLLSIMLLSIHLHEHFPAQQKLSLITPDREDYFKAKVTLNKLRRLPSPILVPYHPWYAVLAGSKAHFHLHALNDITASGKPYPEDLVKALKNGKYKSIVYDRYGSIYHRQIPGMLNYYNLDYKFGSKYAPVFSGNPCGAKYIWIRKNLTKNVHKTY
ncbi:MAG: hypothetical protein ACQES9_01030 [Myxococcota bacterium]